MQSFWDTLYYESQAKQDISRESDTLYIYHFTTKELQPTAWKCILNGADQGKMTKIAFLIVSIGAYYEIYTTCSTLQKCKTNYVKMMRAKLNSIMRSLERSYAINRSRYKMLYRISDLLVSESAFERRSNFKRYCQAQSPNSKYFNSRFQRFRLWLTLKSLGTHPPTHP